MHSKDIIFMTSLGNTSIDIQLFPIVFVIVVQREQSHADTHNPFQILLTLSLHVFTNRVNVGLIAKGKALNYNVPYLIP